MTKSLAIGDKAPDFTLPGDGGSEIALAALKGSKVVLYFYPKDDTSGCTKEAIAFNGLRKSFEKAGAVIIGVSPDSPKSHDKFKDKYELNFPLASDEAKSMLSAYGVWVEKSMYGRKYMGVERSTFLIDGQGKIAALWTKVKVDSHAEEVLKAVQAL
jgi:peroxiredoxin Q/BCP